MTSPVSVGQVSIEVVAEARSLAKSLKREVENAFKGLDLSKAIQNAARGIKVKVDPVIDTTTIGDKVKKARVPKVPVALDPVLKAFQQEVLRQTAALSRQTIKIPVDGDTAGLRAGLSAQLASIQAQSKIQVPTEPGAKAAYETRLRAQLAEVAARVKQTVEVKVDVDGGSGSSGLAGLAGVFKGIVSALPSMGRFSSGLADIAGSVQKLSGSSAQLGGNLTGAFVAASGPIGLVIGALAVAAAAVAAIGTAAVLAVPAVSALAGAIAAIPGALVGVGAVFGTLSLGFKGISDAFKPKAGGGGGSAGEDAASRARRIAGAERGVEAARRGITAATRGLESAERGYADAQRRVSEAQERLAKTQDAINRARREAKEDIEDLGRAMRGAVLDEEDAGLRVTEALRALNQARESGILPDIQRAELEYRQAQLAVENAKDATEDLGEASKDANKKGVEGSDKVQDALKDQKDAIQAVRDAQVGVIEAQNGVLGANDALKSSYDSLASAQDGLAAANKKAASSGGGGALGSIVKLAPNAQKFVNAIKALKPAFEDLRLDVQNRLFAGLDKTITRLAEAYKAPLKRIFGSYADTFNKAFKNLGTSLGKPQFIADLETGAEGFRKGLDKILTAVSGPLVEAFGTLSAASAPFLEALGDEIADVVTEFSKWVQSGKDSGALTDFFDNATKAMHDIFDIGGSVVKIIGSIITIIAGRRRIGTGKSPLEEFKDGLKKVSDYLDDPAVQEGIRQFFGDIEDGFIAVARFIKKIDGWVNKIKALKTAITGSDEGSAGKTGTAAANAAGGLGDAARKAGFTPIAGAAAGKPVGEATGGGFIEGLKFALKRLFQTIPDLLWSGPDSLIGKIKSGLGIASPSTLTTEMGKELINGLIKGIGDKIGALKAKARELPARIRDAFGNAATFLGQKGRDFVGGLINGIGERFPALRDRATTLKNVITGVFSNSGSTLTSAGRNVGASLANGIVAMYGPTRTRAQGLKNTVSNAFTNAGRILYNAGQVIAQGLQQGIDNQRPNLGKYLNALGAYIKANKGPIAADRKLLIPEGQAIMEGLIGGIASKRDALGAELSNLTGMVAATTFPELGVQADAAISSSLSTASAITVQGSWAPGMTGDPILDALSRVVKLRFNGNAQAAFGT